MDSLSRSYLPGAGLSWEERRTLADYTRALATLRADREAAIEAGKIRTAEQLGWQIVRLRGTIRRVRWSYETTRAGASSLKRWDSR